MNILHPVCWTWLANQRPYVAYILADHGDDNDVNCGHKSGVHTQIIVRFDAKCWQLPHISISWMVSRGTHFDRHISRPANESFRVNGISNGRDAPVSWRVPSSMPFTFSTHSAHKACALKNDEHVLHNLCYVCCVFVCTRWHAALLLSSPSVFNIVSPQQRWLQLWIANISLSLCVVLCARGFEIDDVKFIITSK